MSESPDGSLVKGILLLRDLTDEDFLRWFPGQGDPVLQQEWQGKDEEMVRRPIGVDTIPMITALYFFRGKFLRKKKARRKQ